MFCSVRFFTEINATNRPSLNNSIVKNENGVKFETIDCILQCNKESHVGNLNPKHKLRFAQRLKLNEYGVTKDLLIKFHSCFWFTLICLN